VEAIELAASAGLVLLEWQQADLMDMLGLDEDDRWVHFEFGENVARQNGKGGILEARELAILEGLTGERLGVHSAHEFKTSEEHFMRLEALFDANADLSRKVKQIRRSHGQEGVYMLDGRRLRFVTRTRSGLRGFAGVDFMSFDEAMIINAASHASMMPTLRASQAPHGPQLVYTGSAVDQEIHDHGLVWARIRERGLAGGDESLGYIEYSLGAEHPDDVSDAQAEDPAVWHEANPSLGVLISEEHMRREQRSMDPRGFAVELLGVGDWPTTDGSANVLIDQESWAAVMDPESVMVDPVSLAFDVSPERHSTITAAGRDERGLMLVEVVASNHGTGWLTDRLIEIYRNHEVQEIVCDGFGPAAAIARKADEAGIKVRLLDSGDYGQACGAFVDAVGERTVRHLGQDELDAAIRGAKARPLVDRWAWSRTKSTVNISPLVAATLALYSAVENDVGEVAIF
jgi:hypothetical protein